MVVAATSDAGSNPAVAWGAVLSMALCVAMLIASEFMPVSLLTPMAEGLRATEGQTGQAISISGLFAVAASMVITTAAGTLNRKWVLVAMTAFMLLSLVLVAAAPNFAVLMIGRALLGICIGGFWALATAVIMRLVPESDVPRALSLMVWRTGHRRGFRRADRQLSGRHVRLARGVLGANAHRCRQPRLACGGLAVAACAPAAGFPNHVRLAEASLFPAWVLPLRCCRGAQRSQCSPICAPFWSR